VKLFIKSSFGRKITKLCRAPAKSVSVSVS
jgi:hypothetical protein